MKDWHKTTLAFVMAFGGFLWALDAKISSVHDRLDAKLDAIRTEQATIHSSVLERMGDMQSRVGKIEGFLGVKAGPEDALRPESPLPPELLRE